MNNFKERLQEQLRGDTKKIKSEAYREFAEKWNNLLAHGRSRLVVQPQIVMKAFELAIMCTNTVLEELTKSNE